MSATLEIMEKSSRYLFVINLPFDLSSEELNQCFSEIGPVTSAFVVLRKDTSQNRGFGYVTYASSDDAEKAISEIHRIKGRPVKVLYADKKMLKRVKEKRKEATSPTKADSLEVTKIKNIKQIKRLCSSRKPRLVIRNLSFKCTEMKLKKLLSKYGELREVSLPLKKDGTNRGFGFAEFTTLEEAHSAMENLNATEILNRTVAVDWAVPKDEYEQANISEELGTLKETLLDMHKSVFVKHLAHSTQEKQLKEYFLQFGTVNRIKLNRDPETQLCKGSGFVEFDSKEDAINVLKLSRNKTHKFLLKERILRVCPVLSRDELVEKIAMTSIPAKENDRISQSQDSENDDEESDEDDENINESDDNTEESGDESDFDDDEKTGDYKQKKKKLIEDSEEEISKTLFVRNLPFDTEDEDLHQLLSKFGKVKLAVVCSNFETGMCKGMGFVHFENSATVDKCIEIAANEMNDEFIIKGRRIFIKRAVSKTMSKKLSSKVKVKNDNRNLYLAREGHIREGTQAAVGVSRVDLDKRERISIAKFKKLKNLDYFVSSTRLCIFNIPPNYDNAKLKKLCLNAIGDKSAKVIEARVMREENSPTARLKGYGYVEFIQHEHALKCLRKLNNNPTIFSKKQRPIVQFSIESYTVRNIKKKRKENNLSKKGLSRKEIEEMTKIKEEEKKSEAEIIPMTNRLQPFPSHFGAKIRHQKRPSTLENKKKKRPANKLSRKEKIAVRKMQTDVLPKKKQKKDNDDFMQTVEKYKTNLLNVKHNKWYND